MTWTAWRVLFQSSRFFTVFLLGFSSGLPLALTGSALEARYATSNVSLKTIGFITLVGLPYVFKFLWAPLMDRYVLPIFGRRRGWIFVCQCALIINLILMAWFRVEDNPWLLGLLALFLSFFSASQDIAIDAYRTDILSPEERGLGIAFFVGAYRAAMLFSGSIGLLIAAEIGFELMYLLMALSLLIGVAATIFSKNPSNDLIVPISLQKAYWNPWVDFFQRPGIFLIILLVVMYKFGDAFAMKLMTTFFIRALNFTLVEIGTVNKLFGFFAMLIGIFVGGWVVSRISLLKALLLFGVFQAVSNLMFVWLAVADKSMTLFVSAVVIDNLCSGMGSAAFFALLMNLCNTQYTATQFALLTALSAVPREISGPLSAYLVENYGWLTMYEISFVFSWPGLILLVMLNKNLIINNK